MTGIRVSSPSLGVCKPKPGGAWVGEELCKPHPIWETHNPQGLREKLGTEVGETGPAPSPLVSMSSCAGRGARAATNPDTCSGPLSGSSPSPAPSLPSCTGAGHAAGGRPGFLSEAHVCCLIRAPQGKKFVATAGAALQPGREEEKLASHSSLWKRDRGTRRKKGKLHQPEALTKLKTVIELSD